MRAYVIKTKNGYGGDFEIKHSLNEAVIFSAKSKAEEGCCEGDNVIPVEIKLVKVKKGRIKK